MLKLKQVKTFPRLALLVLLVMPSLCWAQIDDKPATKLLKDYMPENCAMSGMFEQQKQLPGLPIPISSLGDFFFYCELGVIWRTTEPFDDTLIYTPHNRYFRIDGKRKVKSLNGVVHHNIANILLAMLGGNADFFMDKFTVAQVEAGIKLLPKSQWLKKGIEKITLEKVSNNIENKIQLAIHSASSEVTLLSIFDVKNIEDVSKKSAFDSCVVSIVSNQACEILRYPGRADVQ